MRDSRPGWRTARYATGNAATVASTAARKLYSSVYPAAPSSGIGATPTTSDGWVSQ